MYFNDYQEKCIENAPFDKLRERHANLWASSFP